MAEGPVIAQAANEIAEEVAVASSGVGGKVMLVIGGICIGFGAGYYFAKRQLETKYNELAETEIKEMREHYLAKSGAIDEKKPELDVVMTDLGYKTPDSPGLEPEPETDGWNYELELAKRSEDVPYVIHKDEFFGSETPFEQIQLTFYEGDDVLADSNDTPVDDQDAMVNVGNLSKFGHGSGDPNVVYIRNHELQLEIEVVHHDGKFGKEVHGFSDDDLQHEHRRQRRKRRFDDEQS